MFPFAKLAVHIVAGVSVSKVVKDLVYNSAQIATKADAFKVWTGCLVIGSVIAEQATKHVDVQIDKLEAWYERENVEKKVKEKIKEKVEEKVEEEEPKDLNGDS